MAITNATGGPALPSDSSDVMKLVQGTGTGSSEIKRGGFRQVLGGIVGAVGNVVAPGVGGILGSVIAGKGATAGPGGTGLLGDSAAYLELQRQMTMEQRQFETASTILKNRHEAAMSAIRNMKA